MTQANGQGETSEVDCTSPPLKLGILGIRGRMGQALLYEAVRTSGVEVVAGATRELSPPISGLFLSDKACEVFERADVVLDFSHHKAVAAHLQDAISSGKPTVVGTTGFQGDELQKMQEASEKIPLVYAPNTSFGIALLQMILRTLARHLGPSYDVEIVDIHHRYKRDAPSGTALLLGAAVQEGRVEGGFPPATMVAGGKSGLREEGTIGLISVRGGCLRGEHQVHFMGPHESISVTHGALGRELFARGALQAVLWVHKQPPGFYKMADVFGLTE